MRRVLVAIAVTLGVIGLVVASLYLTRPQPPAVAMSPSPTPTASTSPTPTTSPTSASSPSPTVAASPVPGFYVNPSMGYAMRIQSPWHRAVCGSSISGGPLEGTDGTEIFIPIPDRDFVQGHIGDPIRGQTDGVFVIARENPQSLAPREWKRQQMGGSVTEKLEDATFAGRPALLITEGGSETFVVANGGYMWQVGHRLQTGNSALADRASMVRSFRFLTADEARAAQAAATPRPAARTPEHVADILAEGFAKRDVSILARVIHPCPYQGNYAAGPDSREAPTHLEALRQRFARGLVVEVRARPIEGDPARSIRIRSTWREPGQPDLDTDLVMSIDRGTTYWHGTVAYPRGR